MLAMVSRRRSSKAPATATCGDPALLTSLLGDREPQRRTEFPFAY
jgi:hypothetical protein